MEKFKKLFVYLLALVMVFSLAACGGKEKATDITQFVTCRFEGADGYAKAVISVDREALETRLTEEWGEELKSEENVVKFYEFLNNVSVSADKETGLSNGDTVNVTVTYDSDKARELGFNVSGSGVKFKVEGLEDAIVIDAFNPDIFGDEEDKTVKVVVGGISPFLSVYIDNRRYYANESPFDISVNYNIVNTDGGYYFKLGDEITITASISDKDIENGYALKEDSFVYKINSAPAYVENPSDLTDELLNQLKDEITNYTSRYPLKIIIDEEGSHFNSTQAYTNMSFEKAWLLVDKEKRNSLYNYVMFQINHDVTNNKGGATGLITYYAFDTIAKDTDGTVVVRDYIIDEQRGAYISQDVADRRFLDKFKETYDFYEINLK